MLSLTRFATCLLAGYSFFMVAGAATASAWQQAGRDYQDRDLPVREVYTLDNPSDRASSEFVVETELPSSCYAAKKPSVRVVLETNVVLFYLQAEKVDESACPNTEDPVPLTEVIRLGKLPVGTYEIREFKNLKRRGHFKVIQSADTNAKVDPYAEIDSATVHSDALGFRRMVTLTGSFDRSCSALTHDTNALFAKTSPNVIEIRPLIAEKGESKCLKEKTPFVRTLAIPDSFESGRYLFHVLAANDKPIDQIDSIEMEIERPQTVVWNSFTKDVHQ